MSGDAQMSGNMLAGVGAGRNRRPYLIREFLAQKGASMASVAEDLGISRQVVQATVKGTRNNRRVLTHLKKLGCPSKYLSLPDDLVRD